MTAVVEQSSVRTAPATGRSTALVAVQHRTARDAAVRILRGLGATDVLAATSLEEARRVATGRPGEIGVVEAELSDGSGTTLVRELRAGGWRRTVVLATEHDPFAVRAALSAGVTCFLAVGPRPDPVPRVPRQAGRHTLPGQIPGQATGRITADAAGGGVRTPSRAEGAPDASEFGLSQREVDVLQLVADGQSNRAVGEALGLSALTVKSHLARIARKLGTGDRAEMVFIALRSGIIA
ncbi:MAG TPA: response regulator transcription factor [Actinomycetales bacterium]|nr:response regulator transcription factor [Actinomycetales bacterium]